MDDCDHLYSDVWCDVCGKYQGQSCEFCGAWYDGGDHMAAQPELWCAAIAEHLDIAPRQVSNALRYWQRRGMVETYLSNDDNYPVWVAVYEYPSLTEIADPDGFWDTKL